MVLLFHLDVGAFAVHLDTFSCRNPEYIIASLPFVSIPPLRDPPVESTYLIKTWPKVPVCFRSIYSSVPESWMFMYEIDTDQSALVFGLSPLQSNNDILVDQRLQHRPWVDRCELRLLAELYSIWLGASTFIAAFVRNPRLVKGGLKNVISQFCTVVQKSRNVYSRSHERSWLRKVLSPAWRDFSCHVSTTSLAT